MTLEQLQYFVAIVESATFFDAAESLHIAQSTLSKQIRNLELELDVQLFESDRGMINPPSTPPGILFSTKAVQ